MVDVPIYVIFCIGTLQICGISFATFSSAVDCPLEGGLLKCKFEISECPCL